MKYSFAIAALMGLVAVNTESVQALDRVHYSQQHLAQHRAEESESESDSDSSSSDSEEDLALQADIYAYNHPIATKWDKKNPHPGYQANHDDFEGLEGYGKYDRQVPDHFSGPGSGDDQFMNSMITNYAVEEATPEGKPTGKFVFRRENARQAAIEIVGTHLGLHGKEAQAYLDEHFDKTFEHFDTAGDGKIEAARMSGFFRFLCGNMQITLH